MQTLQEKFDVIEETLESVIFERTREIKGALLALVSGKHFLMVGPPGIAKSYLVDTLVRLIDFEGHYFKYLMTRFTGPDEIFGPPSFTALKKDDYRRVTTRRLPDARVAFLDETFKANSSILNSMLTILNEGVFYNGAEEVHCELNTLFGTSNELPKEIELAALWDRITFRFEVMPLLSPESRKKMFQTHLDGTVDSLKSVISWDELQQAKAESSLIEVNDDIQDRLIQIQDALRQQNIEPTDRRIVDSIPVIRAQAWRNNRKSVDPDDLGPLRHILWVDIKDQGAVNQAVLAVANPIDHKAYSLIESANMYAHQVQDMFAREESQSKRRAQAVEIQEKLEELSGEIKSLSEEADSMNKKSDLIKEAESLVSATAKTMISGLFPEETV